MPTILVVDDSAVDRRFVGGLLEEDDHFEIEYAEQGREALDRIDHTLLDLVVTDLMMPEMDGLELVAAVRSQFPLIPVILMTSKGSEEIAVRALQEGAASYVPKRNLAGNLLGTVRRVLSAASHERNQSRLMDCMTRNECTFALENDPTLFGPLIAYLQEEVTRLGICDEAERTRFGVALEEALANAIYHGNLEVGSQLREEDHLAYFELIESRRRQSPYRERRIFVEAKLAPDGAAVVVRDEGSGFDPSALPDPTTPDNLDKAFGRGVLLMRTFMDEVVYNDVGNTVTLKKHCS